MKQAMDWTDEIFARYKGGTVCGALKSIINEVIARAQLDALRVGRSQNTSCGCRVQVFSDELEKVNAELHSLGIPWVDSDGKTIPTTVDRLRVLVKGYKDRLEQANERTDEADRHYRYLMTMLKGIADEVLVPSINNKATQFDEPEVQAVFSKIRLLRNKCNQLIGTVALLRADAQAGVELANAGGQPSDPDFEVEPIEEAWWMVFNPYPRGRKPEIRHPSKDVAIEEAKRLAAKEGNKFHVLEKIWTAQPPPKPAETKAPVWCDHIKWGKHQQGDQIYEMDWIISIGEGFCARVPQEWVHCPVNHCNAERPF